MQRAEYWLCREHNFRIKNVNVFDKHNLCKDNLFVKIEYNIKNNESEFQILKKQDVEGKKE